jgi:hypothetical protein
LALLRSWVQIPPGPLLSVLELRYGLSSILDDCRTNIAAMPMPYPTVCPTSCPTKVEIITINQEQEQDEEEEKDDSL